MKILELTQNYGTQNSVLQKANSIKEKATAKAEYEKILAEKIANALDTMEQMNQMQAELDLNRELHKELTGKDPASDDDRNNTSESKETIKRIMPDGSIVFMTVQDGEVIELHKKKPHLVAVADLSAPKTPAGQTALKMQQRLDLSDLFMLM